MDGRSQCQDAHGSLSSAFGAMDLESRGFGGTTKLQMGQNLVTCGYDILVIYIFGMIFVWKFASGFV